MRLAYLARGILYLRILDAARNGEQVMQRFVVQRADDLQAQGIPYQLDGHGVVHVLLYGDTMLVGADDYDKYWG